MTRKGLLLLVLTMFVAGGTFAQTNYSIGGGGFFGNDFGGGITGSSSDGLFNITTEMPNAGGGAYAFLDAAYMEVALGIFFAGSPVKITTTVNGQSESDSHDLNLMSFNIGLFVKYPFAVNEAVTFFPLLGIEYQSVFSAVFNGDKENVPDDYSTLWLKLGGGVDYSITSKIFFRAEALYGIRLSSKVEKDTEKELVKNFAFRTETLLGHGLTVNLGIGYRF